MIAGYTLLQYQTLQFSWRLLMANVFERTEMNGMSLSNRFVRSATWEGRAAEDGSVTPELTDMMVQLALGGVGLVITGYAFVKPEGQSSPRQLAAYDDRFMAGWREMTEVVHKAGGKIALQLVHGGCAANPNLTKLQAVGPSERSNGEATSREATRDDLLSIVDAFKQAARRAKEAGFDAVQLHAAHGFLLSQFLSPALNKRADNYGGNLENRTRLLLEVVQQVREAVGPTFPVLIKLNSEDFLENGLTREEAVEVAAMLEKASIDAIEYSGGTVFSASERIAPRPGFLKGPENEVYYREAANLFKQKVKIPLILVGGIRSFAVAEELVSNRLTDYIALARPLICEPDLINRWKTGDHRRAECVSDNACFGPAVQGSGDFCATMSPKRKKEATANTISSM
jgi:2,4-dienoyl-CoA reductase-like NADH-dependent reductase (Old Yellow Enzyme family)